MTIRAKASLECVSVQPIGAHLDSNQVVRGDIDWVVAHCADLISKGFKIRTFAVKADVPHPTTSIEVQEARQLVSNYPGDGGPLVDAIRYLLLVIEQLEAKP